MKFLQVLSYATLATALPSPLPVDDSSAIVTMERRASTVVNTFTDSIAKLQDATTANIGSIQSAIQTIKSNTNTNATSQAITLINNNFKAIAAALKTATSQISSSGSGSSFGSFFGSSSGSSITGLTQTQLNQTTTALQQATSILQDIHGALSLTSNSLKGSGSAAVSTQGNNVQSLASAFTIPLMGLTSQISSASTSNNNKLSTTGLTSGLSGLFTIFGKLASGF